MNGRSSAAPEGGRINDRGALVPLCGGLREPSVHTAFALRPKEVRHNSLFCLVFVGITISTNWRASVSRPSLARTHEHRSPRAQLPEVIFLWALFRPQGRACFDKQLHNIRMAVGRSIPKDGPSLVTPWVTVQLCRAIGPQGHQNEITQRLMNPSGR